MRHSGAERVSEDAVVALQEAVEDTAESIAEEALRAARHARRRTVTRDDIQLATK